MLLCWPKAANPEPRAGGAEPAAREEGQVGHTEERPAAQLGANQLALRPRIACEDAHRRPNEQLEPKEVGGGIAGQAEEQAPARRLAEEDRLAGADGHRVE